MTPLVIIGIGGHGREALDIVEAINAREPTYDFLGFVDEHPGGDAPIASRGHRVIGGLDEMRALGAHCVIGIGSGEARRRIDGQLVEWGVDVATLVHPEATLGSQVHLGPGVVVAAGARLTTNITLGRHAHVNVNASVSHDCRVGDYVTVSPGVTVSGTVVIDEGVLLGAGSTVIQNLHIGAWTTVGAGAVVIDDLVAGITAVGVPARDVGARSSR